MLRLSQPDGLAVLRVLLRVPVCWGSSAENLDMPSLRHAADNAALDATIRQSCTAWTGALAPVPAYRAPATMRRIDSHQVPCRYGLHAASMHHRGSRIFMG